ncbi:MAG: hypothetical protein DRO40_01600 [Thermoprotei archaeon]|nr:MAG: hypothetical protein DRO40_01600 [Thermoprotei archaeon]
MVLSIEEIFGFKPKRVLVYGGGGGGDVVSAAVLASALKRIGVEAFIGGVGWERFIIDPVPGPIKIHEYRNVEKINEYTILVTKDTIVEREGHVFKPQTAYVSEAVKEPIIVIDLWHGVKGYAEGLVKTSKYFNIDGFILVDVGGDIIATGCEEELWSPLADMMSLAAFYKAKKDVSIVALHSIGSDGELDQDYILKRITHACSKGGYLGARGLTPYDAKLLEKILKMAHSEASLIPLLAFKGLFGYKEIRRSTRKVLVSPIQLITFFLKLETVYNLSPLAQLISETSTLYETKEIMNNYGVYTELDLEEDLRAYGGKVDGETILSVRKKGLKKLKKYRLRLCRQA